MTQERNLKENLLRALERMGLEATPEGGLQQKERTLEEALDVIRSSPETVAELRSRINSFFEEAPEGSDADGYIFTSTRVEAEACAIVFGGTVVENVAFEDEDGEVCAADYGVYFDRAPEMH